ncbi:MAG TPA: T9SS type A sorting domain-containing protein [bacterium]|nr:T9SS type A sorting domain-containing protein [bacterium]
MSKLFFRIQFILILIFTFMPAQKLKKQPIAVDAPPALRKVSPEQVTVKRLAKPVEVGDTTFFIRSDINETQNVNLEEVAFYRKYSGDLIEVYVEVAEFDSNRVTEADVDSIVDRLVNKTPEGSINPDKGIYANEIDVVGDPPDVDYNGKLNVLLIDVRDGYDPETSTSYVAGYFDPLDQMGTRGNFSEIIYIDTNPADLTSEYVHTIVAHELQHLIHYNYDTNEADWLNEGMSVLVPKILGFEGRNFGSFLAKPNNKLNNWEGTLEDYSKVGLWTYYIFNRFGIDFISDVIQTDVNSLDSYNAVLDERTSISSVREVMRDWFVANLINDPTIEGGIYGYQNNPIPDIRTDHFSSSFTDGEFKNITLKSGAAEYIQFYQGQDLFLEMEHDLENYFGMVVIKHKEEPEVTIQNLESGQYEFSDETFGYDYSKISFIPYWASISEFETDMEISYKATGTGGTRETELVHDGDSISFYITLGGVEAGEKFQIPDNAVSVSGIKFNMYKDCQATVKIYEDIGSAPIKVYEDVSAPGMTWKRIDFDDNMLQDSESFVVSITSQEALGYSNTGTGAGQSYLRTEEGGDFRELNQFELQDGTVLRGNWLIRALVNITSPASLALSEKEIYLWEGETDTSFKVINSGTEGLDWQIDTTLDWLSFSQTSGSVSYGNDKIDITVHREDMEPGLNEARIPISTNIGNDTLFISVLERNTEQPQALCAVDSSAFGENEQFLTLKLFNIGTGRSEFMFPDPPPSLAFSPPSGVISLDEKGRSDTVNVNIFINRDFINQRTINFSFFNGVNTVEKSLEYTGKLQLDPDQKLDMATPFPNPFNRKEYNAVNFRFLLPEAGDVEISIFNILGQRVRTYDLNNQREGINLVQWDGKNNLGTYVGSGIFIVQLKHKSKTITKKMVLIK